MHQKPYIIAISGGTCSGKSTASKQLLDLISRDYRISLLEMDTYFKKDIPMTIAPITRIEYVEHNHPDSLELDRFYADFEREKNAENDFLIVDGLFALYLDQVRESADLKIFVDLASDARLARRIKRHLEWRDSYDEITARYLDTVRFRHNELIEPTRWHADIILNGTLDQNKAVDVVLQYLRAQKT